MKPKPPTSRERPAALTVPAQSLLFYGVSPVAFSKLKGVLDFHQLSFTEPLRNTILVTRSADLLSAAVDQWNESLSTEDRAEVRAAMLDSASPTEAEIARAILSLEPLEHVLERLQGRWLPGLLAADSIFIMFQPLVSLSKRRTVAYECLVRARSEGIVIGAEKLLRTARVLGLSHELDQAVWRRAIKQGSALVQEGHLLFLNFTPSAIASEHQGLLHTMEFFREGGLDTERLVFEVTEAERVRDESQLKRVIRECRLQGTKVALDDLGSGYSSILQLADLLPDYVKLDQGLVRGAHQDQVRAVFLKAIADAAHNLGIFVVAEGIETEEDLKFCIAIDADLAQGYYIARPSEIPQLASVEAIQTLSEWTRDVGAPS